MHILAHKESLISLNDLNVYLDFSKIKSKTKTDLLGNNLTWYGDATFETVDNIPAVRFSDNNGGRVDLLDWTFSGGAFTKCIWFKCTGTTEQHFLNYNHESRNLPELAIYPDGKLHIVENKHQMISDLTYNDNVWHFVVIRYNGEGNYKVYVDNIMIKNETFDIDTNSYYAMRINRWIDGANHPTNGYLAGVKFYTRALEDYEIIRLYKEYKKN